MNPTGADGWTSQGVVQPFVNGQTHTFDSLTPASSYVLGVEAYQSAPGAAVTRWSSNTVVVNAATWDPLGAAIASGPNTSRMAVPSGAVWVSPAPAGVNDADCGTTETNACATVLEAYNKTPTGGTIVLAGGTYRGAGNVGWKITKPVTIMAEPGTTPVVSGTVTIPSSTGWWWTGTTTAGGQKVWARGGFYTSGGNTDWGAVAWARFPDVEHSEWIHAGREAAGAFEQLAVGGSPVGQVVATAPAGVTDNSFAFAPGDGADDTVYLARLADPTGTELEWAQHRKAFTITSNASNTRIIGITFDRFASGEHDPDNTGSYAAGTIVHVDGVQLIDVTITNSSGRGLFIGGASNTNRAKNTLLRRVSVDANGATGVDAHRTENLRIESSRITQNNASGFNWESAGAYSIHAGIKITRSAGLVMRFNTVGWNQAQGIWFDLYCDNALVVGNHIKGNHGSGVFVEISQDIHVVDNVIAENGVATGPNEDPHRAGVVIGGSRSVYVQRNTFTQSWDAHIEAYDDDDIVSPGRNSGTPTGFPWNPNFRLDANLHAESQYGDPKRTIWLRYNPSIASTAFTTPWYLGASSNGHVQSSTDGNRFEVEPQDLTPPYGSPHTFNNAYPGTEYQYQLLTTTTPWAIFQAPGSGEDYRVTNSTVNGWTGPKIGADNPKAGAIMTELLLQPANNSSGVGARFHT